MKILIFGTGSSTMLYIRDCKEYFDNIEILGFVDNNKDKLGKEISKKKIISPYAISDFDYDVILICSVYEEEVYNQLVFTLDICEKKIYTRRRFFEKFVFPWYDEKYNLYNKKILIISENYATDKEYRKYYGRYCDLFNVTKIISINEIYLIQNYEYDYILLTNFSPVVLQNKKLLEDNLSIIDNLVKNYIILTNEVISIYFANIREIQYGNDYSDKKFLIIRSSGYFAGLGIIALTAAKGIEYAKTKGYIPIIDMQTQETQYLEDEEYGKVNAYIKFFKQPDGYDVNDIKNAKSVSIMYGAKWFSEKKEDRLIFPNMQSELYDKYCNFKKKFKNKKVLGVLFRGTDYANLKPYGHNIQPDLYSMIQVVKEKIEKWGEFDLIYLCTEVKEACEKFEIEFGKEKVCYYPQLRYKSDTKKYLADIPLLKGEHTEQGKSYWIALNCLAVCDSIIAGQCAGTKIATIINNYKYKNKYLFKLGKYGIDDV